MEKKQSGFDIDLGNQCSKNAYNWSKKTFANRAGKAGALQTNVDGTFSALMDFNGARIGMASDGIGTKIELAERTEIYHTLGFDLVAMVADDLIASGIVPTSINNIIDVDVLDYNIIDQLMRGLHDAANMANMAITGGEIAELGSRINGYGSNMHFNWASTAIGILHPALAQPIDGSTVVAGHVVVSLKSRGFRSNGFSAIRRSMNAAFGGEWHKQAYNNNTSWGEVLLTPSLVYCAAIAKLLDEGVALHGIVHVTGGGIADNLQRVLKVNALGAELNNLFSPHSIMNEVQALGNLTNEQAYLYWNMGNGMLLLTDEKNAQQVISILGKLNYQAQIAGVITDSPGISIQQNKLQLTYTF